MQVGRQETPAVDQIVTGEAVALDLRPAQLVSRMLSTGIDYAVQFALLLGGIFAVSRVPLDGAASAALFLVLIVLVLVGYPVALETLWRGKTLGKAALGLRTVRDDAGPIGFRQALVRGLTGGLVESPGLFLVGTGIAVGLLTMIIHPRGKRLGDVLAGTLVIRERVKAPEVVTLAMPPPLAGWAATLDLSGVPDPLLQDARQFLGRSKMLSSPAREQLGGQLVAAITDRLGATPPPGTPGWAVIAAVLAERRAREERRAAELGVGTPGYTTLSFAGVGFGGDRPVGAGYGPGDAPAPADPTTRRPTPPSGGGFALPG